MSQGVGAARSGHTGHAPGAALNGTPAVASAERVLVVGSGPTGLFAAALLGHAGVPTLLVEQNPDTSDEAKAISLDDESLRVLQRVGLLDLVLPVILPGTGTLYVGADGKPIVHARGPQPPRHGHPFKSAFQQPELEAVLRQGLQRYPGVQASFSTTLLDLRQEADGVWATLVYPDGRVAEQRFTYVLGCDGGRSTVRKLLDIRMVGSSFQQPWIVLDTVNDSRQERYGLHVGDPRRPTVIIPGLNGHCRYELLLRPGEGQAGDQVPFDLVRQLLAPYRRVTEQDVKRRTVYTFHALVADRWRAGRVLLLGDAAHMMPPFAGQGMNAGVRDAANLVWKLVAVLRGQAGDGLLDSYEMERRPHAEAMVALSARLGWIVMTTNPTTARLRDGLARLAMRTPWGRRYLEEMRYRPPAVYTRGAVVPGPGLVGATLPQGWVFPVQAGAGRAQGERVLLDSLLGPGWALVAVDPRTDLLGRLTKPLWDALGATRAELMSGERWARPDAQYPVVVAEDGRHQALLRPHQDQVLLVRPDRYVAAAFTPDQESAVAARLQAVLGHPTVAASAPHWKDIAAR